MRRFAASYRTQPAGRPHRLVVLIDGGVHPWVEQILCPIAAESIVLPEPVLDLDAYRMALSGFAAPAYCFFNSHSTLETSGWLDKLLTPLNESTVGIVGAGGSFESLRDSLRPSLTPLWRPRMSLRSRLDLVRDFVNTSRTFPAHPNAHVRTNAFAVRDDVIRRVAWPDAPTKEASWAFESGARGLSAQVKRLGYKLVVVGADGRAFDEANWHRSRTVRSGDQSNLLVHDRRTREYADAPTERRCELADLAWGVRGQTY